MVVEQTAITDPKTRTDSVKGPARSTHTVTLQCTLSLLAIVKAYLFNGERKGGLDTAERVWSWMESFVGISCSLPPVAYFLPGLGCFSHSIIEVSLVNVRMYTYNQGVATLGFGLPHPKLNLHAQYGGLSS